MKILLLHGYSGSPKNFASLKQDLEKKKFKVFSPELPFHKSMKELAKHDFDEFVSWIRKEVKKTKPDVIIGYSLGAQLARIASQEKSVKKIIVICSPDVLKFPFNQAWLGSLFRKRIYTIKKPSSLAEHHKVPYYGLAITAQANRFLEQVEVRKPELQLFVKPDTVIKVSKLPLAKRRIILKKQGSGHNPFEPELYDQTKEIIFSFLSE